VRSISLLGDVIAEMLADAGLVDSGLVRAPFEHLCRGLSSSNVRAR
jgi:phycobilisome core component